MTNANGILHASPVASEPAEAKPAVALEPSLTIDAALFRHHLGVRERKFWQLKAANMLPAALTLGGKKLLWLRADVERFLIDCRGDIERFRATEKARKK